MNWQRLSSSGYVFSASLPPYLASAAITAIDVLEENPEPITKLKKNIATVHQGSSIYSYTNLKNTIFYSHSFYIVYVKYILSISLYQILKKSRLIRCARPRISKWYTIPNCVSQIEKLHRKLEGRSSTARRYCWPRKLFRPRSSWLCATSIVTKTIQHTNLGFSFRC